MKYKKELTQVPFDFYINFFGEELEKPLFSKKGFLVKYLFY